MILICIRKVSAAGPVTVVCIHKLPHHMCRAQVFCGNIDCQLPILPATNFLGGKTQRGLGGGRLWSRSGKSVTGETEEVEVDRCLPTIHVLFHGSGVGGGRSVQGQRWPSHACTLPPPPPPQTLSFPVLACKVPANLCTLPCLWSILHTQTIRLLIFTVCYVVFCSVQQAYKHKITKLRWKQKSCARKTQCKHKIGQFTHPPTTYPSH